MTERNATWYNVGMDVNTNSIEEVLEKADLNYTVVGRPLKYRVADKYYNVDNKMITIRQDKPEENFGIVSSNYQILQNSEAFDFVSSIDENLEFIKAGTTRGGIIYVISRLDEVEVLGDKIRPHLIFQNGHNGFVTIKANICMLRMICQNQFNYAFAEASNAVSIRHNGDINEKMVNAKETLIRTKEYIAAYKNMAENFATTKINDRILQKIISEMLIKGKDIDDVEDKRGYIKKDIETFTEAYHNEDNQNFIGTAWGVINAYTDFSTHLAPKKVSKNYFENRFVRNTFDNKGITKLVDVIQDVAA